MQEKGFNNEIVTSIERKKVAVLLPWLKMGGTNKIALNFINELTGYCDVTLILSEKSGELLSELKENIRLIIDEMDDFRQIVRNDINSFRIGYFVKDCIYYFKIKAGMDGVDNYRYIVERHGYITENLFDCAISYHGQSPERLLNLLYRMHAHKKVVWIHGEISFPQKKMNELKKYYGRIDHFFFVSTPTMESFINYYPFAKNKSTVYYNPINKTEIIQKSKEEFQNSFSSDFINILTVGRLSSEKGQDMIPAIMRALLDKEIHVRWYLIGDGDAKSRIQTLIHQYKVEENVFLLGTLNNPYCYMRACDIYVQPSYTEGYSTTICEAGILGKAIIGTKPSGGIRDQISHGEDGLIVDATVDGLTDGILTLINNRELRNLFENRITKKGFEGKGEIHKFLSYLENA